ncbi:MAG: copper chaperone PCu(A)C, partial [Steroidobacteraceae bacterium]|nr:copper chaperone PCu(A)C [Steroidobacteraceae bacterium]
DNRGRRADRLLSISTPRAESAQVHVTIRELDQVRMRRVDPLHVAAGERLVLEPGGTHVMLMGLRSPLLAGEKLPLTLLFETGGEVKVDANVVAASPAAVDPHAHHAQ